MTGRTSSQEGMLTSSVERLRQELDRWLDAAVSQGERAIDAIGLRTGERDWCPPADVVETGDAIRIELEIPGVDPQNVELTLAGNMLTIVAPIPAAECPETEKAFRCERPRGQFRRSIPLPASVNPEDVSAESKLGVLTVRVGKVEKSRERKIPVRAVERSPEHS